MRSPAVRFAALVLFVCAGLAAAYHFGLIDWLRQGSVADRVMALRDPWWTPLALIGLCTLAGCLPLPTTAVVLIGGAVYGPWRGWALNLLGCVCGAVAGYALARALGRDFAIRILGPKRWAKLDGLMQEHGFWTMVRARWMLPLAVVDYGAGIGGMKVLPFLVSSVVGMAFPVAIYTYVGHLLLVAPNANPAKTLAKAAALVLALLAMSLAAPGWRFVKGWRAARRSGAD
jgi:uncharacterized membrane protein YdjX (TVP38/TMEM64 family)